MISDSLGALVHPTVRGDAIASARHRAFMAPRLLGSLAALAAFPLYLALRAAPTMAEAVAFAWLIAPILLSTFLSRTGRLEAAQVLSSIALSGFALTMGVFGGGLSAFVAALLVLVPFEAALSASRRAMAIATALAVACAAILAGVQAVEIPAAAGVETSLFASLGMVAVLLYAAGLGFGAVTIGRVSAALLAREIERYQMIAGNMTDVVARHRRNGAVEFASSAAECVLGSPASELLAHGLFDRVHVADRPAYLTALSIAAVDGEARTVEFRLRRNDNRLGNVEFIWIEMQCRPQAGSSAGADRAVVSVLRDITARKGQQHALERAQADAERSDQSKRHFLATMSHELRTPLNAIIGFSDMMLHEDELRIDAARRKEYAQLINDSGCHLLSVVNGILDMSKIDAGNYEIVAEPFAARPAILNCCNLLALKAKENEIDLVTNVPDNLPSISGDPRAFKQVMLNLVSNAIKFTNHGGAVHVAARAERAHLVVTVADTGVGIGDDDLKRIGDPFFQACKNYDRRHEGTGLGLSIVKNLVAMHGGEMTVQSRLDEGTTVTIMLPLEFSPPAVPADNVARLVPAIRIAQSDQNLQVKKIA